MKRWLILSLLIFSTGLESNVDLVSNLSNPKVMLMNRLSVQNIFTRKMTRWSNGDNIVVFIKPLESIEHKDFVSNVLRMSPFNYKKNLDAQLYTGKSTGVMEIPTDDSMIWKVVSTPGGVGYINYDIIVSNKIVHIVDGDSVN